MMTIIIYDHHMMMTMTICWQLVWVAAAAGCVDTGSILHPPHQLPPNFQNFPTHNFLRKNHQTLLVIWLVFICTKIMTYCITINEISQKIMFSQIALPASTPARWRASWAVPFWPKTPELELLDKSVISRAHISITIQPGPPQLPLSSEYLSPISQSRRMVMMNQERKSL